MKSNGKPNNKVIVTGGLGFIGSHAVISLYDAGYTPIILDDLSNASRDQLDKISEICGKTFEFYHTDIRDYQSLLDIFTEVAASSLIHFAGLKSVPESKSKPIEYFDVNVNGFNKVLQACSATNIQHVIFSSSATIYDENQAPPVKESNALAPINNYGWSKMFGERILESVCDLGNIKGVSLRYFNPIGCHPSGIIGENLDGTANNLLPHVLRTALGLQTLSIYGTDYPTKDGTGERDYIHVIDLAKAHVDVLTHTLSMKTNYDVFNVGLGNATSVKELTSTFESITQTNLQTQNMERRPGDIAISYADNSKLLSQTNWQPQYSLSEMIEHAWNYAQKTHK